MQFTGPADAFGAKPRLMNSPSEVVMGREALLAANGDPMRKFGGGEIDAVSLRVFMSDGIWEDIALGENAKDRAQPSWSSCASCTQAPNDPPLTTTEPGRVLRVLQGPAPHVIGCFRNRPPTEPIPASQLAVDGQ